MRKALKIIIPLGILFFLVHVVLVVTDNTHLYKAVNSTYLSGQTGPSIDDHNKFENRRVKTGVTKPWEKAEEYNKQELPEKYGKVHEELETVAFLVLKKGELLYENYREEYGPESKTNSFSMAKTFVSLLIGIAVDEGHIKSIEQPVKDYLPEFTDDERLKIKHLLSMTSGINFDESYNHPLKYMAKTYYGRDIKRITYQYKVTEEPGSTWRYLGGNTLLLAMIIEKSTGKTVSRYFQDKIWKKTGASEQALWTVDSKGLERAFCCFYSNARDFARIGQLMLDSGKWEGKQIIPPAFLEKATQPLNVNNAHGETVDYYGYQIWLFDHKGLQGFFARGILGQYIIVIPEKEIVVVRLGRKRSDKYIDNHPSDIYDYIDAALYLDPGKGN